jgi:hypothetical protein
MIPMGFWTPNTLFSRGEAGEHLTLEPLGSDGIILLQGCRGLLDLDHATGDAISGENDQDVRAVLGDVILGEGGHVPVQLGRHQSCSQVPRKLGLEIVLAREVDAFGGWVNGVDK